MINEELDKTLADYLDFCIVMDNLMSSNQISKAYSLLLNKKYEVADKIAKLTK